MNYDNQLKQYIYKQKLKYENKYLVVVDGKVIINDEYLNMLNKQYFMISSGTNSDSNSNPN